MSNPPRIWLDYRPVRIGWVLDGPSIAALTAAAHFNSCLWGGRFNPIIPCRDAQLAAALVKLFNVDVLVPVQATEQTAAFISSWPHLRLKIWGDSIFRDRHCEFVDVRHAVKRALRAPEFARDRFIRPTWTNSDPLAPLLSLIFGSYPDPGVITIDYARGIHSMLEFPDNAIGATNQLAPELQESVTPLLFTGFDLTVQRDRSGWLAPGIVLGDLASFDDLLLFWNLRAAGAQLCFYDRAHTHRLRPFLDAFLAALRRRPAEASNRVNFWSRALDWPAPQGWTIDLDITGLQPNFCRDQGEDIWDGYNIRPVRPKFSAWHRDVVSSYNETEDRATAAFALPDRPYDDDDPLALDQRYFVTVDAEQYGAGLDDRLVTGASCGA